MVRGDWLYIVNLLRGWGDDGKKINVNLYRNKMLKIILHCFCLILFTYIYTHYDWIFSSGIFIFNKIFFKKKIRRRRQHNIQASKWHVYSYMNINHDLNFPYINLFQLLHFPISNFRKTGSVNWSLKIELIFIWNNIKLLNSP